ncbi:MAG: LUD domain-containing protein, partial [Anaerolineales bacterium]|nr:LUD domain-containing protein [Anaerolineales bacterium]
LTSYVTLIQGPGRPQSEDGSEHRYVILVDNGRRRLHGTPLAEALMCIRCGACLNSCPVFQELGGHAYGSPYPGPIGSVVSPALFGVKAFGHLAMASTLCGACKEACPIGIDIPRMLLHLRQEYVSTGSGRRDLRWGLRAFAWAVTHPAGFAFGQRLAGAAAALAPRAAGWLGWLPPPGASWTRSRHFPPFASRTLHRRWRETKAIPRATTAGHPVEPPAQASSTPAATARRSSGSLIEGFTQALMAVSGEVSRVPTDGIADALRRLLPADRGPGLAAQNDESDSQLRRQMEMAGFEFLDIHWPGASTARPIEAASWGMVRARAALADTGTVVLPSIPVGTLVASLLPPTLVVVLQQSDIHADLASWLAAGGRTLVSESSMVALVTGPSRTSDIEMTMTLGVHGPGRLVVLLTP